MRWAAMETSSLRTRNGRTAQGREAERSGDGELMAEMGRLWDQLGKEPRA